MEVKDGIATSFREKPLLDGWINAGFYVLNKKVFDYITVIAVFGKMNH
jgi:glucose-1-phosphate cytidylyltransferase